jgi:hypothetical protein
MIGKIKSSLLTYLFKDWVAKEKDVELLSLTKQLIDNRIVTVDPTRKPTIGYRQYSTNS